MKKALLSLTAFALSQAASFATIDLGYAVSRTPYEAYMSPVKQVLSSVQDTEPKMDRVQALMRQGRLFRYSHTDPYNPALPEQTAKRRVGDCKDKSLWLCDQLQDTSARFVIGKMKRNSRISHAWVMWQAEGGRWWILDCTMSFNPIPADSVGPNAYVPLYSYAKGTAFRHGGQSSSLASVAGRTKAPVAAKSPSKRGVATKEPVAAGGVRLAAN